MNQPYCFVEVDLRTSSRLQIVDLVSFLPSQCIEIIFATEVTVVCGVAVNWAEQVELRDDVRWLEGENFLHCINDLRFVDLIGAKSIGMN